MKLLLIATVGVTALEGGVVINEREDNIDQLRVYDREALFPLFWRTRENVQSQKFTYSKCILFRIDLKGASF